MNLIKPQLLVLNGENIEFVFARPRIESFVAVAAASMCFLIDAWTVKVFSPDC